MNNVMTLQSLYPQLFPRQIISFQTFPASLLPNDMMYSMGETEWNMFGLGESSPVFNWPSKFRFV